MKYLFPIFTLFSLILSGCNFPNVNQSIGEADTNIISKPDLKLTTDIMTPEVLWSFGRISEVNLSPKRDMLVFGIKYYNIEQNKGNNDLYTMDINGNFFKQITKTNFSEYNPSFTPDGKKIAFLSPESGSMQIWTMNVDGSNKIQISFIDGNINGFKYSPDGKKILFIKEVKLDTTAQDKYKDLPKSTGKILKDMMYRHWDSWNESYSHIFIADVSDSIKSAVDIMAGEQYNSPRKPFGGMEEINWSPNSKLIAYTCVKKKGIAYALSTNSDIYIYNIETKKTTNISKGNMGYDACPVFSKNGKLLAWESMEHDGYESDKNRIFIKNLETGEITNYSKNFDYNARQFTWKGNYKLYFISNYHGSDEIFELALNTDSIKRITYGIHDYRSVFVTEKGLIGARQSMSMPTELFSINPKTGKETQISFINQDILKQLTMGNVKAQWIKTFDNKDMLVWLIYPPHFDSTKVYPAILYCQGGPQSTVSQFWSYRWNFQMMAANGYIIIAPNRRGLPGFGTKWNEQISGDYGGKNMKDYLTAIDKFSKEPYIDKNRLGAVGASYGGFSVYWLAGHHKKRFKAFIAHDGIFNLESQYVETDELWFPNWDLGGAPWHNTPITRRSYANSPHKFVDKWDTPILIIHGGRDYRILDAQGFSAFNAAKIKNIPAEMLYFPDENHWVLKPQNGILWQRTFFEWLDKWLK